MDKTKALEAIKKLKKANSKRNFVQSYDLIITLKGLDLKKPDHKIDTYVTLHYPRGKKAKIGAFVGPELASDAKKVFDTVITPDDFQKYSDIKAMKKLADEHAFFIAQANIMGKVATQFGKILGTRGKMPNPKAGCVVPPKGTNFEALYSKLQKTVRLITKNNLMVQCTVGTEDMDDEEVAVNIVDVYNQLTHNLINHENNIGKVLLKMTMSKPVVVEK